MGQVCWRVYLQPSERGPLPESPTVLDFLTISRTVEPDHRSAKREEIRLQRSVIGHEDRGTIKDLRTVTDVLDLIPHLSTEPELTDSIVTGMIVSDHMPSDFAPPDDDIEHVLKVMAEGRGCFWHAGELCVPVKGNGHGGWLCLTPFPGVPRVKSWRPDSEGRLVRVDSPPSIGGYLARYYESDSVSVLFWSTGPVGFGGRNEATVHLTGSVFEVDTGPIEMPVEITVPGDHEDVVASQSRARTDSIICPPMLGWQCVVYGS